MEAWSGFHVFKTVRYGILTFLQPIDICYLESGWMRGFYILYFCSVAEVCVLLSARPGYCWIVAVQFYTCSAWPEQFGFILLFTEILQYHIYNNLTHIFRSLFTKWHVNKNKCSVFQCICRLSAVWLCSTIEPDVNQIGTVKKINVWMLLLPAPVESVGLGRMFGFECLFVCFSVCLSSVLFVRSITQKRMIPKCPNLVQRMTLGYSTSDMLLGLKGKRSRSQGQ